jgi:predicted dehydrogenase
MNVALIGNGYWGKNILRNLIENSTTKSITLCDINPERTITVGYTSFPIHTTTDAEIAIKNTEIQAVIIATPASTHYSLAKSALLAGKHVLIEKPFCTSVVHAQELCRIADERNLVLMVDHIYLYNPVVRQLKTILEEGSNGNLNYIDATRINLGIYQTDTNVLWDLACHDVAVINYLVTEKPRAVRAVGKVNPLHEMEDVVYLFMHYASGLLVHINASWASPVKMRKMIFGGEKQMIIYDDIDPTNKLIIYDYGQNIPADANKSLLIDYRLGNITIPKVEIQEPLKNVITEFYQSIMQHTQPLSSGSHALETVRILEAAQQSLTAGGALMPL